MAACTSETSSLRYGRKCTLFRPSQFLLVCVIVLMFQYLRKTCIACNLRSVFICTNYVLLSWWGWFFSVGFVLFPSPAPYLLLVPIHCVLLLLSDDYYWSSSFLHIHIIFLNTLHFYLLLPSTPNYSSLIINAWTNSLSCPCSLCLNLSSAESHPSPPPSALCSLPPSL